MEESARGDGKNFIREGEGMASKCEGKGGMVYFDSCRDYFLRLDLRSEKGSDGGAELTHICTMGRVSCGCAHRSGWVKKEKAQRYCRNLLPCSC